MAKQSLTFALALFCSITCGAGISLDRQRYVATLAVAKANATAELKSCEHKCSSQWVKGQTAKTQDSSDAWVKRCAWPACRGCARCSALAGEVNLAKIAKLAKVAKLSGKCDGFCSGAEYAFKAWETKCTWSSCKGCSACSKKSFARISGEAVEFTEERSAIAAKASAAAEAEAGRLAQSALATAATHAAEVAEVAAAEAKHTAEMAHAEAAAKANEFAVAKATAQDALDKLSTSFALHALQLPKTAGTKVKCESWCGSQQYANKTWDAKCGWKDCTGCSTCGTLLAVEANRLKIAEEKSGVVDRILAAVADFASNEGTKDVKGLATDLVSAIHMSAVAAAEQEKKFTPPSHLGAKVICEESCEKNWVVGQTLQDQYSQKSWETRCAWKTCTGCPRCSTIFMGLGAY